MIGPAVNALERRILEELRARPGSEPGLRQRIGPLGKVVDLADGLRHLRELGLVERSGPPARESPLDEFVITGGGLSLLGERPAPQPEVQWPHDPDLEGEPPELMASVAALLVALLDGSVLALADITRAVNATRGREWVTNAGVLAVLAADPDAFVQVRPGQWTLRLDPGAQGAAVPARPYPPTLENGAAVTLLIA